MIFSTRGTPQSWRGKDSFERNADCVVSLLSVLFVWRFLILVRESEGCKVVIGVVDVDSCCFVCVVVSVEVRITSESAGAVWIAFDGTVSAFVVVVVDVVCIEDIWVVSICIGDVSCFRTLIVVAPVCIGPSVDVVEDVDSDVVGGSGSR